MITIVFVLFCCETEEKKYVQNSCFWSGILPRSPSPVRGFWKSPRASATASVRRFAPHSGPRARRAALGDFQNPRTGDGDLGKIPDQKHEFCTYFSPVSHQNNTITILRTFSKAYYFNIHCYMLRKKTLLKSKNLFYNLDQKSFSVP